MRVRCVRGGSHGEPLIALHWQHRSHHWQHHRRLSGEGRLGSLPRPGLGPALEMSKCDRETGEGAAGAGFPAPCWLPCPPPVPSHPPTSSQAAASPKCHVCSLFASLLSAWDRLFLHFWGYESASCRKLCLTTVWVFIILYGTVYLFFLLTTLWLP